MAVKLVDGAVRQGDEKWIATELVVKVITTRDSVGKAGRPGIGRIEPPTCNGGVRGAVPTPEPRMVAPERTLMNEYREAYPVFTQESVRRFKRSELLADACMCTDAGIEGLDLRGNERVLLAELVLEILHANDHDVRGRRGVAGVAPVRTSRAI